MGQYAHVPDDALSLHVSRPHCAGADIAACTKKGELGLRAVRLVETVDGEAIRRSHMFVIGYVTSVNVSAAHF